MNMSSGTPRAEIDVTEDLARRLLEAQHPDLASLPLRVFRSGFDNVMVRLGEDYLLRLPRREVAASLVVHEQEWLPQVAPRLPLPVPSPLRIGVPGEGYPWRWSVLPWLDGVEVGAADLRPEEAVRLGRFWRALHEPVVGAPDNPWRGVALREREAAVEERMENVAAKTDCITPRIRAHWQAALAAPVATTSVLLHGDAHPRNLLMEGGKLAAVVDWGDMTSGDRATDLASFWMLFDDPALRDAGLEAAGARDDALLARTRGWAIAFAVFLLSVGLVDDPVHEAVGRATLRRLDEVAP